MKTCLLLALVWLPKKYLLWFLWIPLGAINLGFHELMGGARGGLSVPRRQRFGGTNAHLRWLDVWALRGLSGNHSTEKHV